MKKVLIILTCLILLIGTIIVTLLSLSLKNNEPKDTDNESPSQSETESKEPEKIITRITTTWAKSYYI